MHALIGRWRIVWVEASAQDAHATAGGETWRMAERMLELASRQPGFLGFEAAREDIGISVSYGESLEAIAGWKANLSYRQAQAKANHWYGSFRVRVCRVEREYGF